MTDAEPIHCHDCGYITAVENGVCSNCGTGPDGFSTAEESGKRFRSIVDAVLADDV